MVGAGRNLTAGAALHTVTTPSAGLPTIRIAFERQARRAVAEPTRDRNCLFVLATAMAAYAALAMYLTRGVRLFVDGVGLFLLNRGLDPDVLLAPLNGHLVLMERSVYAAGLALFGPDFVAFRLVETAGALLAVGVLYVYVRRRIGSLAALPLALLVLFLGSAWEVTIAPDVMTNVYSAAAGLGALLALDRRDRRGDLGACLLLAASIACWTLGLAFAVTAAVRIALERGRRRQLWVVVVPLAVYAAWLVWLRVTTLPHHLQTLQHISPSSIPEIPNAIVDEAAAVAGSAAGLNHDFHSQDPLAVLSTDLSFGIPIAALGLAALLYRLRRGAIQAALWAAIAGLISFWTILALSFGVRRDPTTIRYVYPGAVLAAVVAAEALRGIRLSRVALVSIGTATALALAANLYRLQDGARFLRNYSMTQAAQLTALEVARGRVDPTFRVPSYFGVDLSAGAYLAAVARNGSPAYTPADLANQREATREAADSTLASALRLSLGPPPAGIRRSRCRHIEPSRSGGVVVTARPPGVIIGAGAAAAVTVGRFGDRPSAALGTTPAGGPAALRIPGDALRIPWHVGVAAGTRPVTLCRWPR